MSRSSATVKWYDPQQGHGFLRPDTHGPDMFVHHSAVHGSGLKLLAPGDRVEYERVETELGPAAEGVVRTR
jgi:cold shock protein